MIADYIVVLDACVLANFAVCDLYLRLAEHQRMILPKWSEDILDEVRRTHIEKLGWPEHLADSFQHKVKENFPEAMISGYEDLIPLMENDKKDRHVLAAAVREKVDIIITFNLKDFRKEHVQKWGIKAIHPQDYLITLYSMNPAAIIGRLSKIAQKRKRDLESVVLTFGVPLPEFSSRILDDMGLSDS